jgi:hypothetical protein
MPTMANIRCVLIAALLALGSAFAFAQGASGSRAPEVELNEDALVLTADFSVQLSSALEDALARGVALYFVLDIDVVRDRLLLNESIATRSETFRLSYTPLTRAWRLSSGLFSQNLSSLDAATRQFTRLRSTKVAERKQLQKGEKYIITARLRHDINQLPKPLQLIALTSRDWQLDAEPIRLTFVP